MGNLPLRSSFCYSLFRARFSPEPTFRTFGQIATGWILSHRHRYITDIIFSGGHLDDGHWCRFHRFFSHAAWDIDVLSMYLAAKLVATLPWRMHILSRAVDDTTGRKRGLTLYGRPACITIRSSPVGGPLVSWGHDWVVLCSIVVHPF